MSQIIKVIIFIITYSAFFIDAFEKGGAIMRLIFNLGNGAVYEGFLDNAKVI